MTSLSTSLKGVQRRIIALLAAVVTVASLAVFADSPEAKASPHRGWLRPDSTGNCEWDPNVAYWVQRCDVFSPAMGRNIPVQIQPAQRGGNAGLYLLDGLRATNKTNAWVNDVNAAQTYENNNITLVMPVGGTASFYADWNRPATFDPLNPVNYKWETFLTQELPAYLERQFGVARNNNSIAGLSMGGTAAITLAGKHPGQFRQALSYSGYLAMTLPFAHTAMHFALLDAGGFNLHAMYGSVISPRRFENDPFLLSGNLRNTDVYVSAASGLPGPPDQQFPIGQQLSGAALEAAALLTTRAWEAKARLEGVPVTSDYPALGMHNWYQFGYQLERSKPRVLDVMNAW